MSSPKSSDVADVSHKYSDGEGRAEHVSPPVIVEPDKGTADEYHQKNTDNQDQDDKKDETRT